MPDRLSALLDRFELRAHVLHAGALGRAGPDAGEAGGRLHLLRRGRLAWSDADGRRHRLDGPALAYVPEPGRCLPLSFDADGVSLALDFGDAAGNPVLQALPPLLVLPLSELPELAPTFELLLKEASEARCGHRSAVNRLAEVLVVQLLRQLMQQRRIDRGVMAGLADVRLARALNAIHADPAGAWTLERMASEAGMSRARFAASFNAAVRLPPGEYLTRWRLSVAKTLLRRGQPVKAVASDVGYGSAAALSRAFTAREGQPPSVWAARQSPGNPNEKRPA